MHACHNSSLNFKRASGTHHTHRHGRTFRQSTACGVDRAGSEQRVESRKTMVIRRGRSEAWLCAAEIVEHPSILAPSCATGAFADRSVAMYGCSPSLHAESARCLGTVVFTSSPRSSGNLFGDDLQLGHVLDAQAQRPCAKWASST